MTSVQWVYTWPIYRMIHIYTSARIVNESLYKPKILLLCIPYKDRPITVEQLVSSGLANSRGSWVVGRMSWVVGKKSWVVGKKSWVVGKKSWVVGKKSWVPRKKSWVLRKKSWVPNKKSWVPRKSRGFQAKCFRIFTFSLLECVFFVF